MVTKEDIQELVITAESVQAMNDALAAAFTNTTDPTVEVTLPNGDTFTMPTYQSLYNQLTDLKSIAVGLQTYGSDDYQVILSQTDNVLCQVSRFNPIIPDIAGNVSVVDGFDIQTDKANKLLRIDFTSRLQSNSDMVLVEYLDSQNQGLIPLIRPVYNNNLASNRVAVITVSSNTETKKTWPISFVTGQIGQLVVGDKVSVSGQLTTISAISLTSVTFATNVTSAQNASIYKVYPDDSVYTLVPIRPCETISLRVISNQRLSNRILVTYTDISTVLTGITFEDAVRSLNASVILPIPLPDQDIPVLESSAYDLNIDGRTNLLSIIANLMGEFNLYKEDCNDAFKQSIASIFYNQLRPLAGTAQETLFRPMLMTFSCSQIVKEYELRYKPVDSNAWSYITESIPVMTQEEADAAQPWQAVLRMPVYQTGTEYQCRVKYMVNQPSQDIMSDWTAIDTITPDTEFENMQEAYGDFLTAMNIGSRMYYTF